MSLDHRAFAALGARAERIPMSSPGPLPGTTHGHLFAATTSPRRPAGHYTPRIIRTSNVAILPLEQPLVAWRT
jgi:hypothetical protein